MRRRPLLKLGVFSGVALALAGSGAVLLFEPAWRDDQLSPTGRVVLDAVARGVLDGTLPTDEARCRDAVYAHLDRMNAALRSMSTATLGEIVQLLAVLASPPGRLALAGLKNDWRAAPKVEVQMALQAMRESRLLIRRQAYHALRDLTHAAYFSDTATWMRLGYPGPAQLE